MFSACSALEISRVGRRKRIGGGVFSLRKSIVSEDHEDEEFFKIQCGHVENNAW